LSIIDILVLLLIQGQVFSTWLGWFGLDILFHYLTMSSRNWRDPSWLGIFSVQNGVDEATRVQRMILFGKNEIDIKGKSTMSLLVDEVTLVTLFLQQ
jgi:hypothetical protein